MGYWFLGERTTAKSHGVPVTFMEISTLEVPWAIEVRDRDAVVGHIRRRPDTGEYCYYPGQNNQLNPSRQSLDLELLKQSILAAH